MAIKKPIIFFSHSSRDKVALKKLKERFVELTGGTVDVFLSSDGQSIRLGSNWVSSIESALDDAKVMFTFVSPQSLHAPWVYFETGHAFGKKKDVVPVGIFGVDIGALSPPLNLLHGFNMDSADLMNNIITKVNEVFSFSHKLGFTGDDFQAFRSQSGYAGSSVLLGEHATAVRSIELSCAIPEEERPPLRDRVAALPGAISRGVDHLILPGASVTFQLNPTAKLVSVRAHIDPIAVPTILAGLEQAFAGCTLHGSGNYWCSLNIGGTQRIQEMYRQMARLTDFAVGNSRDSFIWNDGAFEVQKVSAQVVSLSLWRPVIRPFGEPALGKLIDLLFERGVLYHCDDTIGD